MCARREPDQTAPTGRASNPAHVGFVRISATSGSSLRSTGGWRVSGSFRRGTRRPPVVVLASRSVGGVGFDRCGERPGSHRCDQRRLPRRGSAVRAYDTAPALTMARCFSWEVDGDRQKGATAPCSLAHHRNFLNRRALPAAVAGGNCAFARRSGPGANPFRGTAACAGSKSTATIC